MKKFIPNNEDRKCAPSKQYSGDSCFTIESLTRMCNAYNNKILKNNFKGELIQITDNKRHLVSQLTKRLENVCDDQICWLKQDFIRELNDNEINEHTFRPEGPQGRFTWLNTTNINEIMAQYEEKYPDFKFFGAVPIDFDKLNYLGIRNLDFDNFCNKDKKQRLGIVYNFDEHWQSGSHWVAMFADLKKNQIYYFDSYGTRPKKQIRIFVNRIAKWCYNRNILNNENNIENSITEHSFMNPNKSNYIEEKLQDIKFNINRHQYKNSECGVYSINFILRLLKGETFENICNNITSDDDVNKCRDVYFRFK